ncbi:MAG: DNA-directed RNA polymerase subunit beta', partial [Acholeplasmataceae bacterium]|nr:DNA-directed RNA polymerase subunit beta' [Acholeplasmataceae bacterium]
DSYLEMGMLNDDERRRLVIEEWKNAGTEIQRGIMKEIDHNNPLYMMSDSGARGSAGNFSQLLGMRGLMSNPKGDTIEVPVQASFREGLTVSEFFISTHGARKGSTDTALKTAESGYLTRRLVDVAQDVIIVEEDCGTEKGTVMKAIYNIENKETVSLTDRIVGRYTAQPIFNPKTGEIIAERNVPISEDLAYQIENSGVTEVMIRSNLTCDSINGVCTKCYGRNLATNKHVEVGEAVGVVAAQSIGEPGTQLTMRTFHTGGVAGSDITLGLPRIQELFEARKPKGKAVITEYDGKVKSLDRERSGALNIVIEDQNKETHEYHANPNIDLLVKKGDKVHAGQKLTKGSINPKELLRAVSVEAAQHYILEEVQLVYRAQGVEISDKHIELIIRQMLKRITVVTEGDTELLPGTEVSINEFKNANRQAFLNKKRPAVGRPILLGITRASLRSDSLLSAASFQETTRILTDAAINAKVDELHGLKENVIIGGLIPAGTGILEETYYKYERDPDVLPTDFEFEGFDRKFY